MAACPATVRRDFLSTPGWENEYRQTLDENGAPQMANLLQGKFFDGDQPSGFDVSRRVTRREGRSTSKAEHRDQEVKKGTRTTMIETLFKHAYLYDNDTVQGKDARHQTLDENGIPLIESTLKNTWHEAQLRDTAEATRAAEAMAKKFFLHKNKSNAGKYSIYHDQHGREYRVQAGPYSALHRRTTTARPHSSLGHGHSRLAGSPTDSMLRDSLASSKESHKLALSPSRKGYSKDHSSALKQAEKLAREQRARIAAVAADPLAQRKVASSYRAACCFQDAMPGIDTWHAANNTDSDQSAATCDDDQVSDGR